MPGWNTPPNSTNEMSPDKAKAKAEVKAKYEKEQNQIRKAMLKKHVDIIQGIYGKGERNLIANKKATTEHAGKKGSTKGPNMNPRSSKRRRTGRSGSKSRSMNGGTRKRKC
jgi:hypothetical protein